MPIHQSIKEGVSNQLFTGSTGILAQTVSARFRARTRGVRRLRLHAGSLRASICAQVASARDRPYCTTHPPENTCKGSFMMLPVRTVRTPTGQPMYVGLRSYGIFLGRNGRNRIFGRRAILAIRFARWSARYCTHPYIIWIIQVCRYNLSPDGRKTDPRGRQFWPQRHVREQSLAPSLLFSHRWRHYNFLFARFVASMKICREQWLYRH